jgi:hypothetical protein
LDGLGFVDSGVDEFHGNVWNDASLGVNDGAEDYAGVGGLSPGRDRRKKSNKQHTPDCKLRKEFHGTSHHRINLRAGTNRCDKDQGGDASLRGFFLKIHGILARITHPDWREKEACCQREKAMYDHLRSHSAQTVGLQYTANQTGVKDKFI